MKAWAINFLRDNKAAQIFLAFVGLVILACLTGKIFPALGGTILCLLLLGGYYGVLLRCLKFCKINFLEILKEDLPRILFVALLGTIFIICVINSQQTIYFGDQLETYEPTLYCEENVFADPYHALKDLRHSINHEDYNKFLPMLMALPMHIFGKSFLCYVLYVWLMFGLPGIFFASATFKTILNESGFKNFPCSALMALIMLLPALELPLLFGYANISILLPGSILLAMLLSLDRAQLQRERLFFIAALCAFAVFQARTAAYMILGIFFGYTVYVIILSLRERSFERDFFLLIKKFFYIGIFGLLITLPLFFTFVKHAVTYDIGTAYSAYRGEMNFAERLFEHIKYLGLLIYGLFIIGAISGLRNKKFAPYAMFFATWFFTAEFLICRIQLIDRQHIYTMIFPLVFVLIMSVVVALSKRKTFGAALIFILAFNFLQAYCPPLHIESIFNRIYFIPDRKDIAEIKNLVTEINNLTAGTDKKIYNFADSIVYNGHTLCKINMPEVHNATPNLIGPAELDLRDGFSTKFFDTDYVLVAEPVQIHLLPQSQQVIVKTSELMVNPSPISRHFKQIKEYTLNPEIYGVSTVTFRIYEKISPFEKSDIDFVEDYFVGLYPNQPELFKNRFEEYKREHFKE